MPNPNCATRTRWMQPGVLWSIFMVLSLVLSACTSVGPSSGELEGTLNISGSTALGPLLDEAEKRFEDRHPKVDVKIEKSGSLQGLDDIIANKVDIGSSDVYADFARYPNPDMTDHLVCVIPFTMIVHKDLIFTPASLTQDQIIDIFTRPEKRNWKEYGGPDLEIVPIVRSPKSGTRDTFRKYVLRGGDEYDQLRVEEKTSDVLKAVGETPGAIGYTALSGVDPTVKTIAIGGYSATKEHIISGRYPYWSYGHLYTLGDDRPVVQAFLDFIMEPEIQEQAEKAKYIPVNEMELQVSTDEPQPRVFKPTEKKEERV